MQIDGSYILAIRRELHKYPELAFDLPKTLALIRRELDSMGIPYTEEYGKSSIVAFINPDCTDFSIGLRADTDALPLTEKTGLPAIHSPTSKSGSPLRLRYSKSATAGSVMEIFFSGTRTRLELNTDTMF